MPDFCPIAVRLYVKLKCYRAAIGDSVVLGIPKVDRGHPTLRTHFAKYLKQRTTRRIPALYKLQNPEKLVFAKRFHSFWVIVFQGCFRQTHKSAESSGHGIKIGGSCNCRAAQKHCQTNRYTCFANVLCNSRCYQNNSCSSK